MFSFKTEAQKKIIIASTEYYRHDIFACTWYFIAFVVFLFFVVVFFLCFRRQRGLLPSHSESVSIDGKLALVRNTTENLLSLKNELNTRFFISILSVG